jgi:hypothetical protein
MAEEVTRPDGPEADPLGARGSVPLPTTAEWAFVVVIAMLSERE